MFSQSLLDGFLSSLSFFRSGDDASLYIGTAIIPTALSCVCTCTNYICGNSLLYNCLGVYHSPWKPVYRTATKFLLAVCLAWVIDVAVQVW